MIAIIFILGSGLSTALFVASSHYFIWEANYLSRGPHRNNALALDVESTATPQRISGWTN